MEEYIKGYHMFLPRTWVKWFIYCIYPVLIISSMYGLNCLLQTSPAFYMGMASGAIVGVEFMVDGYVFSGISTGRMYQLEYLKTSVKGIPLLGKALAADAVRRFLSIAVILIGVGLTVHKEGACAQPVQCMLWVYLIIEAGLMILRFFNNVSLTLAAIYITIFFAVVAVVLTYSVTVPAWIVSLIVAVDFGIALLERNIILKKVGESYYDERMEKTNKAHKI